MIKDISLQKTSLYIFYIAFIEGAAVMSVELSGVKMIASYYGTTLYVWASVLSVTLGGLALGYFLGGRIASRIEGSKSLPVIILVGAFFVAMMPKISSWVMPAMDSLGVRIGSLVSAVCFIMPALICMGMVSPVIIQFGIKEIKNTGRLAGTVYAVSTVGGICMTLLTGFYLLPELGVVNTILITALLLVSSAALFYYKRKNFFISSMTGLMTFFLLFIVFKKSFQTHLPEGVLYQSEGVLGQVRVLDYIDTQNRKMRTLMLNGVSQNLMVEKFKPFSSWKYPHRISTLASFKPKNSKALLIGLAGGSIAMELKGLGFQVDAVEIDPRMPKIPEKYFGFNPEGVQIILDDGRHYINTTTNTYDVIVIDVLNGEIQPQHLFTNESLKKIKGIIRPDGLLMINFQGYINGEKGLAARSIFKTLEHSGFELNYFTDQNGEEDGDVLFIASLEKKNFKEQNIDEMRLNLCCQIQGFHLNYSDLITEKKIDVIDASVLTDDKPVFEKLNIAWTEEYRKKAMLDGRDDVVNNKLSIYN